MSDLAYPYHFDAAGRTAQTGSAEHVRDLIEQVLFTAPGERVMRPDFGAGLAALVFEPNSDALAATTQVLVQAALQQHLADCLVLQAVDVTHAEGTLTVHVAYRLRSDGSVRTATFTRPGS